jgi:hypothetical protein
MRKIIGIISGLLAIIGIVLIVVFLLGRYNIIEMKFGDRTPTPVYPSSNLVQQEFITGSTTVVAVQNPYNASSTIDLFVYRQTGVATSTHALDCGTTTSRYLSPSDTIIDDVEITTSTLTYLENGFSSLGGYKSAGTNSQQKIFVKPTEWFVCKATTVSSVYDNAFTNASSTFRGDFSLRWFK